MPVSRAEASKKHVQQMAVHVASAAKAEEEAERHRNAALAAEDRSLSCSIPALAYTIAY